MKRRLGVCSWSLRPESPEALVRSVRATGLDAVQLALDPIRTGAWDEVATREALSRADVSILSGMMGTKGEDYSTLETIRRTGGVRPDAMWDENLIAAKENAALASRLGISLVTFHAGFLPHDRRDAERGKMIERLRVIADVFADRGVRVAFETGQESAGTLLEVLDELSRPRVGVNFDPANMILYGMGEPVAAAKALAAHIVQFHIKDAVAAETPGSWGTEVVAGTGAVRWREFFEAAAGVAGDFVIEREAGEMRVADVVAARGVVKRFGGVE